MPPSDLIRRWDHCYKTSSISRSGAVLSHAMRSVSIVLVLYAVSMLFQGSLEGIHDVLHYLNEHQITSLHNHDHAHHHSAGDHMHHHKHHTHEEIDHHEKEEPGSGAINFFLYVQKFPGFAFNRTELNRIYAMQDDVPCIEQQPLDPPPEFNI